MKVVARTKHGRCACSSPLERVLFVLLHKALSVAGLVALVSLLLLSPVHAQEPAPVVHAYLFYSETCPTCQTVRRQVIPALYRQYGQQFHAKAIEVTSSDANYRWMEDVLAAYDVAEEEAKVPILFIGDQYLVGAQIQAELPDLIQKGIDAGGIAYPDVPAPADAPAPTARFMFFYSPTCPHCAYIEENVLPPLKAKYGDQLSWEAYDVSTEANYRALVGLGQLASLPADARGAVPVVFIGDEYSLYSLLLGDVQIEGFLEMAIDWYLDVGGVDLPEWSGQLFEMAQSPLPDATAQPVPTGPAATPTLSEAAPTPSEAAPIHLAYFAEVGCSECDRVGNLLNVVQQRYPNLVVHEFDIIDDIGINLCLSEALNVPEKRRHDAPAIFVGDQYLVGDQIQLDPLIAMLEPYAKSGAAPQWESCTGEVAVPPPAPWWAVIVPGLIDGINPCAFATIVFFVSYLTLIQRKGREIILVGVAFTVAIFLSYLGFGVLLRQLLAGVIDLVGPILKPILNVLTALACVVLAALSFADYRKARRGRARDMSLRLPDRLRRWINRTIRNSMGARSLNRMLGASFVTGVVVSFVELTCTGQVYAPIILGLSNPAYQGRALLSLAVYCLAFVVPLILVFAFSYVGTGSRQLGVFLQRHTATVKLVTALLFIAIGAWLLYDTLRVWGVVGPLLA
jgi:cytochrome c biogenesis protein CcdA/thiol-disulfide isomerase/thioredoxin